MSEMKLPRLPKSKFPDVTYQRCYIGTVYTPEQMKSYAMRAVLAEREACAIVCDDLAGILIGHKDNDGGEIAVVLRDAIRSRK